MDLCKEILHELSILLDICISLFYLFVKHSSEGVREGRRERISHLLVRSLDAVAGLSQGKAGSLELHLASHGGD